MVDGELILSQCIRVSFTVAKQWSHKVKIFSLTILFVDYLFMNFSDNILSGFDSSYIVILLFIKNILREF